MAARSACHAHTTCQPGVSLVHQWERGFDVERQTLTSDPRNKVAVLWRRKFECPMILSTGRWKTTGKLGKRCHHGGIASPAEEETIDEAGRAAVLESDVEDGDQAFPSHLCRWSASACLGQQRQN